MTKNSKKLSIPERHTSDVFDEKSEAARSRWRNLAAFWVLGLCNNYGYVVMLSAAHDILESKFHSTNGVTTPTNGSILNTTGIRSCNTLSTGAILLADILPSLVVKVITPFLPFYIQIPRGVVEHY